MNTHSRLLSRVAALLVSVGLAASATGCDKKAEAGGSSASPSSDAKAQTGCGAAAGPLAGIAILEVKNVPDGKDEGVKFVHQLESELTQACDEKGFEKTKGDALTCYAANKGKAGYRVLKGCDEAPGKELVAAVVDKHGGKK